MSTVNRVVKNTGYLYMKMGVTVLISLYTTRLILNSLGASDFGIFNILGGAIGMLGFLNSTLANATQRFMSYTEGKGCHIEKCKIFNVSLIIHIFIAGLTLILLLGAMYPLFDGILNIEPNRVFSAKVVYLSLVFSTVFTIINVPYDAVINSHENMLYYSIVGIFEALLRLAVAIACVYTSVDKLMLYGVLMALIPVISLSMMIIYCHKHYEECRLHLRKYYDIDLVKQIASFSGWNLLTAVSSLFSAQGIGVVLNHYFGTILNASQGIAQQINGQLSSFSANMLKALNPVIQKNAGMNDEEQMNRITIAGCKFSTYLVLVFAIPFIIEMPCILKLWLNNVPEWAVLFCVLQLIQTIICQMASSAATEVYAKGDIKGYAVYKSVMNFLPIVITYIAFKFGGSPLWLYLPMIIVWGIGGNMVIIHYAHTKCNLSIHHYLNEVVLPVFLVTLVMIMFGSITLLSFRPSLLRLISTCCMTTFGMLISILLWGLSYDEKQYLKMLCASVLDKYRKLL